jgi:hypothetical protein
MLTLSTPFVDAKQDSKKNSHIVQLVPYCLTKPIIEAPGVQAKKAGEAVQRVQQLQASADKERSRAEEASKRAEQLAAQLSRADSGVEGKVAAAAKQADALKVQLEVSRARKERTSFANAQLSFALPARVARSICAEGAIQSMSGALK